MAWALREIMAKEGGMGMCNIAVRKKIIYYKWMNYFKGAVDPMGDEFEDVHPGIIQEEHPEESVSVGCGCL